MNSNKAVSQLKKLSKLGSRMRLAAEKWNKPWKTLIATIMSARTRDETTIPVAQRLFNKYSNVSKLANASLKDIQKIIRPVNFYRNKSKSVLNCAKVLNEKFKGKVPVKEEDLLNLPGVGRKTANVFLSEKGEDAIAIDTHCSYISQKLGWTKNKNPHKIEEDLKRLFPKKYWSKINPILVRFGKTYISRRKKDELLKMIK
jgi:endonuclease-3